MIDGKTLVLLDSAGTTLARYDAQSADTENK